MSRRLARRVYAAAEIVAGSVMVAGVIYALLFLGGALQMLLEAPL